MAGLWQVSTQQELAACTWEEGYGGPTPEGTPLILGRARAYSLPKEKLSFEIHTL